jgi:leucyl-tRNA synthetase
MRTGSENLFFLDRVLLNEINHFIQGTTENYSNMQFREGIQLGWFGMLSARNEYRSWCHDSNISLHKDIILKWCESLIIMICPVCPHWSEAVWKLLGKTGFVINASWPVADEEDKLLTRQFQFLRDSLKMFRSQVSKAKKEWNDATILITDSLPKWKIDTLVWLQSQYDTTFPPDLMKKLKTWTKTSSNTKVIKNWNLFPM